MDHTQVDSVVAVVDGVHAMQHINAVCHQHYNPRGSGRGSVYTADTLIVTASRQSRPLDSPCVLNLIDCGPSGMMMSGTQSKARTMDTNDLRYAIVASLMTSTATTTALQRRAWRKRVVD